MTVDSKEEALAIASLTGIHYFGKHLEFSLGASDSYASPGQVPPPFPSDSYAFPRQVPSPHPPTPQARQVKPWRFRIPRQQAAQQGGATARHIIREAQ